MSDLHSERSVPLTVWAEAALRVEGTRSRLEKAAHVGDLLTTLEGDDLQRAARWFAGHAFEISDGRTVNVGHAAILRALEPATGLSKDELRAKLVALGDPGTLAHETLPPRDSRLTFADLDLLFGMLAATRKRAEQHALLAAFLDDATPLEARYAVRLLARDLRIGMKEAGVEDALARAFDVELDEVRRANMLVGSLGETALRAQAGTLGEAAMRLFHPVAFMLAGAADTADELEKLIPDGLAIEDKFDGIRCHAHIGEPNGAPLGRPVGSRHVAVFSRQRSDVTRSFPEVVDALAAALPEGDWILDGEIVALSPDGNVAPFAALQQRLGRVRVPKDLLAEIPTVLIAYDVLYAGELVIERPLAKRRALLVDALAGTDWHVRLSDQEV